ncbi:MAG: HAD family hydrolase [Anaeroplasmataceae bacterium]
MKTHLLCIDSDGTAIDAMTPKHENAFGPAYLDIMNTKDSKVLEYWLEYNLYSKTRGVNRFIGFYDVTKKFFPNEIGLIEFEKFINSGNKLSNNSIEQLILTEKNNSLFVKALNWSKLVNEKIKSVKSDVFKYVKETLELASKNAYITIVSSANKAAITAEWTHHNIIEYVSDIFTQEDGSKSECIKKSMIKYNIEKQNILMLGDALADYEAALDNDVSFYPIIVKNENNSWKLFKEEVLIEFLEDSLSEDKIQDLINQFKNKLK